MSVFTYYNEWQRRGILPFAGGYEDQPLEIMNRLEFIRFVDVTREMEKQSNLGDFTADQLEYITWCNDVVQ